MIKVAYGLISTGFSIDKENNGLSIFNQFDRVLAPNVPGIMPELCVIAFFERDDSDEDKIPVLLKIVAPSGAEKELGSINVIFEGKNKNRFTVRIQGFPIMEFGKHLIRIEWGENRYDVGFDVEEAKAKLQSLPA